MALGLGLAVALLLPGLAHGRPAGEPLRRDSLPPRARIADVTHWSEVAALRGWERDDVLRRAAASVRGARALTALSVAGGVGSAVLMAVGVNQFRGVKPERDARIEGPPSGTPWIVSGGALGLGVIGVFVGAAGLDQRAVDQAASVGERLPDGPVGTWRWGSPEPPQRAPGVVPER